MELQVGSILEGKVTSITKFGAFVALDNGKSGLVHISEIANTFVNDVHDFLQEGQTVKKGDLLVSFDMDAIKAAGYLCTTPMIVCNTDDYKEIKAVASGTVKASQDLLEIKN